MPSQNSTEFEASQVGKRREQTDDEVVRLPRSAKVIKIQRDLLSEKSNTELMDICARLIEITTTWKNPIQEQFDMLDDVQAVIKARNIHV